MAAVGRAGELGCTVPPSAAARLVLVLLRGSHSPDTAHLARTLNFVALLTLCAASFQPGSGTAAATCTSAGAASTAPHPPPVAACRS